MKLIIAEKPVVAKAIANAIDGIEKIENQVIYKGDYAIIWAHGHLLELKDPEDYDSSYSKWNLEQLPIFFHNWEKKPKKSSKGFSPENRLNQIRDLLKGASEVIHAGDPDDEGQYLIDEILLYHKYSGSVYRIDTCDTSKGSLKRALNNLKDNNLFISRGLSAHARSVADKMVGYNCSRYFTIKNPGVLLSVGRVQTATLGLVVERDRLIENHIKQAFYDIYADIVINGHKVKAKYEPGKDDPNLDDGKITSKIYAENKYEMLRDASLKNIKVTYTVVNENAPLPFNLVELQSYCGSHFGYDPSETLEITQSLRDKYNAITYNRSDCQYLTEEQYKEAPSTMNTVIQNISYRPKALDMSLRSKCFDEENVTAHTAIIPQNEKVDINAFSEKERNVYLAICKYFMAQFMPAAVKGKTKLEVILSDGGKLVAHSSKIIDKGYLQIFKKDIKNGDIKKDEENELSEISQGTYAGDVTDQKIEEKETKAPSRYTKTSLNKDMTRIAVYVKDPEVKKLLLAKDKGKKGENGSIGTSATRAGIIDLLEQRGYIAPGKNKSIVSTPLGRELYRILPDELKKADMTAYWWAIQEDIQNGSAEWTKLTDSVLDMIEHVIESEYPSVDMDIIPDNLKRKKMSKESTPSNSTSLGICPRCGSPVYEGKLNFYCSNYKNNCKFTIWKNPKMLMFSKTTITSSDVKKWLSSEWIGNDVKVSGATVKMKGLYSSRKNKTFEGSVYLKDDKNSEYGPTFQLKM